MLVVANTVRASLVRGSEVAPDSQFSMSAGDNTPEDDSGTASVSEMESEFMELRIFSSRTSWDGRGAVASVEEEAPMACQVVYGGGQNRTTMQPLQLLSVERQRHRVLLDGTLWKVHVMGDMANRGGALLTGINYLGNTVCSANQMNLRTLFKTCVISVLTHGSPL